MSNFVFPSNEKKRQIPKFSRITTAPEREIERFSQFPLVYVLSWIKKERRCFSQDKNLFQFFNKTPNIILIKYKCYL